jgi:hypothetical protein
MINTLILITNSANKENYIEIMNNINSILQQSDKLVIVVEDTHSNDCSDETQFLKQLKYNIRTQKIKHLYVYSLLHLYSNRSAIREFLILCRRSGVIVHSYQEQWLPAVMGLSEGAFVTQITKRLTEVNYLTGDLPRKARTKTGFTVGK